MHAQALAIVAALASSSVLDRAPQEIVPGRALIKLRGIDAHDVRAAFALASIASKHGMTIELVRPIFLGWAEVELRESAKMPSETETRALIENLAVDRGVDQISVEHWWKKLATPNDPGLAQMWHFQAIGAEQAWDITTGNSSQRIGIVDTGLLLDHEDVGSRAVNGWDFVSDPTAANDGDGRDSDYGDPGDACGNEPSSFHGTHVAGTIGATANNGKGVAGLNWNAGLVIARVLGRCGGSDVDIMEGAAWLAGAHIDGVPDVGSDKVSVMNLSLGGSSDCSSYDQGIVDFINQQGTYFVAAAGNDSGLVGSPGNCSGVVTVAAFGPTGNIAGYSDFGPEVAVVAPGGDETVDGTQGGVLSSIGPNASEYAFLEGTSMAAPHVTGAISLLQAVQPNLARTELIAALQSSGQSCGGCNGVPMLNLPSALFAIGATASAPPSSSPPPAPSTSVDDQYEPNDDLAHATPASCGVDDSTLIAAEDNPDFYSLMPPANSEVAIAIHALNGADLDLYVVDDQGNILADSVSDTGDERIAGTASGAELFIVVLGYDDPNTGVHNSGPYELKIDCGAAAQTASNDFDPGNSNAPVSNTVNGGSLGSPNGAPPASGSVHVAPADPSKSHRAHGHGAIVSGRVAVAEGCAQSGSTPAAWCGLAVLVVVVRRRRRG
jgi:serine protease